MRSLHILRFKKLLIGYGIFIENAYIVINRGSVIEFGKYSPFILKKFSRYRIKYYDFTAVNGFVNAHTHLIFSNVSSKSPMKFSSFYNFAKFLNEKTKNWTDNDYKKSYLYGVKLLRSSNSTLVIDFIPHNILTLIKDTTDNTIISVPEFIVSQKKLIKKIIRQIQEFRVVALHSLYSVHKDFIIKVYEKLPDAMYILHFAEFKDENLFLQKRKGLVCDLFNLYGRDIKDFFIPRKSIVRHLLTLPIINNKLLLIHSNYLNEKEITTISKSNAVFVKCLRSSLNLNNKIDNVEYLINNKAPMALGTDSVVSSPTLDVLDEARFIKKQFKIDNLTLWKYLTGYYLNGFFEDYSFGFIQSSKRLILNLYDINIKNFADLVEDIFTISNLKPVKKIVT